MRAYPRLTRPVLATSAGLRGDDAARLRGGWRTFPRLLIFLAMIIEAGLPVFPRVPLTGLLFILSGVAVLLRGGLGRPTRPLFFVPVIVLIEMTFLHEGASPEQIISRFVNFCSVIFLVDLYIREDRNRLADDMRPILRLMAVQGIITVILANGAPSFFSAIPLDNYEYKTILFLFTYHTTLIDTFAKADGFFFERGVFQIFLNLFLYFSLFSYRSRFDAALAAMGVLSTWSTTGAVIMVMLFTASALLSPERAANRSRAGTIAFIGILLVALAPLVFFNVQDKLYGDQASSAYARQFDFIAGAQIVADNPLVGLGFSNDVFAAAFRAKATLAAGGELLAERGMSNGILRLFITVGVPLGFILLFGLFNSRLVPNPRVAGLLISTSLISEPIIFCPFILLLVFSGLVVEFRPRRANAPRTSSMPRGRLPRGPRMLSG